MVALRVPGSARRTALFRASRSRVSCGGRGSRRRLAGPVVAVLRERGGPLLDPPVVPVLVAVVVVQLFLLGLLGLLGLGSRVGNGSGRSDVDLDDLGGGRRGGLFGNLGGFLGRVVRGGGVVVRGFGLGRRRVVGLGGFLGRVDDRGLLVGSRLLDGRGRAPRDVGEGHDRLAGGESARRQQCHDADRPNEHLPRLHSGGTSCATVSVGKKCATRGTLAPPTAAPVVTGFRQDARRPCALEADLNSP